jgi:outer membrane protein OmpA-like peptidoglycan-associated protein
MLEKKDGQITEQKAAELKNSILEKAYTEQAAGKEGKKTEETAGAVTDGNDNKEGPKSAESGETTVSSQPPATNEAHPEVAKQEVAAVSAVTGKQESLTETNSKVTVEAGEAPKKAPPQEENPKGLPPFEPKKLILPLQANALKLTAKAEADVDNLLKKIKDYPQITLLVKGYVSSDNDSPENTTLSQKRADNVRSLLVTKGLAENRVQAIGMGIQEPIASNKTSSGREKNRRVEIIAQ